MGPVGSIPQTYAHYVLSALQKVRAYTEGKPVRRENNDLEESYTDPDKTDHDLPPQMIYVDLKTYLYMQGAVLDLF